MYMKKTLALFMSALLVFLCVCFSGCDMPGVKQKTTLTTDNIDQYITVELKGGGDDFTYMYSDYYAKALSVTGSITGVPGYTYENVSITISCTFTGTKHSGIWGETVTQTVTTIANLNVGGSATVVANEKADNYMKDVSCLGYEIISVSGTVTKD